jgi:hypothetical protein
MTTHGAVLICVACAFGVSVINMNSTVITIALMMMLSVDMAEPSWAVPLCISGNANQVPHQKYWKDSAACNFHAT